MLSLLGLTGTSIFLVVTDLDFIGEHFEMSFLPENQTDTKNTVQLPTLHESNFRLRSVILIFRGPLRGFLENGLFTIFLKKRDPFKDFLLRLIQKQHIFSILLIALANFVVAIVVEKFISENRKFWGFWKRFQPLRHKNKKVNKYSYNFI